MASKAVQIFYKVSNFFVATAIFFDQNLNSYTSTKLFIIYGVFYYCLIFSLGVFLEEPLTKIILLYKGISLMKILDTLDTITRMILFLVMSFGLAHSTPLLVRSLNELDAIRRTMVKIFKFNAFEKFNNRMLLTLIFSICICLTVISNGFRYFKSDYIAIFRTCLTVPCFTFTAASEILAFLNIECVLDSLLGVIEEQKRINSDQIRLVFDLYYDIIHTTRILSKAYRVQKFLHLLFAWVMITLYFYYDYDAILNFDNQNCKKLMVILNFGINFTLLICSSFAWGRVWNQVSSSVFIG